MPVGPHPQGRQRHLRGLGIAQFAVHKVLDRLARGKIPAPHYMANALVKVVDHHGKLVGPGPVCAAKYYRIVGKSKPPSAWSAQGPTAVGADSRVGIRPRPLRRGHGLVHIPPRALAGKNQIFGLELLQRLLVGCSAQGLLGHLPIPFQSEPGEVASPALGKLRLAPLGV